MFMPYGGNLFPSSSQSINTSMMSTDNNVSTTCAPSNVFMKSPSVRDQETPSNLPMMMPVPMMIPSFHLMPPSIEFGLTEPILFILFHLLSFNIFGKLCLPSIQYYFYFKLYHGNYRYHNYDSYF
jgi:hypothetical protein